MAGLLVVRVVGGLVCKVVDFGGFLSDGAAVETSKSIISSSSVFLSSTT